MPCYPALALLLGSAMALDSDWIRRGTRVLAVVAACAGIATLSLFLLTRNIPAPGDISQALSHHPGAYTLSLGHMQDLTLTSFAYLRSPLLLASIAFCVGGVASWRMNGQRAFLGAALMMVLFFHAARLAMAVFDPYLSSRPLAEAILKSPEGTLIIDHHYYTYSSIFFYTESHRTVKERALQQSGIRSRSAGRAGCIYQRFAIRDFVAQAGTVLHRGGSKCRSAAGIFGGRFASYGCCGERG